MNTSDLVINIVEPSPAVPNTGLLSQEFNNTSGIIVTAGISLILLVLVIFATVKFLRRRKDGIYTRRYNFKRHFLKFYSNKRALTCLSSLVLVALAATSIILSNQFSDNHAVAEDAGNSLSVSVDDVIITAELDEEAVYAEATSTITVGDATTKGYTLSAYMDNDTVYLNGDTSSEDKISAVGLYASSLQDNTWGMSISKPQNQSSEIFRGLPTALDEATPIRVTGYEETPANDQTVVYFGAYLTPDLDYGQYTGVTVTYIATAHVDTSADDVTINFHGNGLYFDENRTIDLNTVTYGNSCDLAYVGGNCESAYKATSPTRVITNTDMENREFEVINIPGADKIQVVVDYTFNDQNEYLAIMSGVIQSRSIITDGELRSISKGSGQEVVTINSDTVSIYDTGGIYNAEFYPIYNKPIDGAPTELTKICNFTKSNNIDDDGIKQTPYADNGSNDLFRTLSIPGADKIRVEIEYALTEGDGGIMVTPYDGYSSLLQLFYMIFGYDSDMSVDIISSENGNVSGKETFTIEGDKVLFFFNLQDDPVENYDYGFYAKLYPIYNNDQAGTELIENCYLKEKVGEYKEPVKYKGGWKIDSDGDGEPDMGPVTYNQLINLIKEHKVDIAGMTIDVYAYNPYTISYDGNGADNGSMDNFYHLNDIPDFDMYLLSPNYKRDGYGFAGWSLSPDTEVNGNDTIYGPNQKVDVVIPDSMFDQNKNITLYAVWVPSSGTLQNWTSCSTMEINQVTALTDSRDNNVYTVAKLADGNCWMTENLRLGSDAEITAENTNKPIEGFALTTSSDLWCRDSEADCINRPMLNTNNTNIGGTNSLGNKLISNPGDIVNYNLGTSGFIWQWYSYGNYYNWYAATAGTGTYSTGENGKEDAIGSICPAGWGLPKGGDYDAETSGSFAYLNKQMGSEDDLRYGAGAETLQKWLSFPVNLVFSGQWWYDDANERGAYGRYWSRTADDEASSFELMSRDSRLEETTASKYYGGSVRCVYGI